MMGSRDGNAGFGQTFLQSFLFFTAFRRFLTNYSKKRFSRLESSLFFSEIAGITVHQALSGQRRNEGQVMTKLQGITEMLGVFPGLGIKRRSRRLSLEELRALSSVVGTRPDRHALPRRRDAACLAVLNTLFQRRALCRQR
jgi:hypothetical protein